MKDIKENEALKEGWVAFTRFHCKEGYIDKWIGDMASSPNSTKRNQWSLNAFSTWFRFNSGEWMSDRELRRDTLFLLLEMKDELTAQEILDKILYEKS